MERTSRQVVTGPLQERIIMQLRSKPMCGKDLMKELGIKSPGTIYPVLDELKNKGLIDFKLETSGAVRKKNYELTAEGKRYLSESLVNSARMFCCDVSLYADTIMRDVREIVTIRRHQRVLCTIEYEDLSKYLGEANITFSTTPETMTDEFDVVLSFPGMGCLLGQDRGELTDFLRILSKRLRSGGNLLVVEIEKTDNLFARIFFEDIRKMPRSPGVDSDKMRSSLRSAGFTNVDIRSRSGMLYAIARKG